VIFGLNRILTNIYIIGGFRNHKPELLKKIIKGYCKAWLTNKASLRFMDIALDYSCNFSCQHCSAEALKKRDLKPLNIQEYRRIAQEAITAGVLAFHFTGGEPLLRTDLLEIIKAFSPKSSLISIQTNGWKVDNQFLDQYREVGGDIVCVSVDSFDSEIHDNFRQKPGSWKKAIESVDMALGKGFQVLMSYTLTHDNIHNGDFDKMIKMSLIKGTTLSLNLAVPAGKWKGNENYLLNKEDRILLNKVLRKCPHVRTDFESNWKTKGCPAFKEKCYLTPYGEILPCPFIHITFGNIRKESLRHIQNKAFQCDYFKKYQNICIAAEDRKFIAEAGCYGIENSSLPISYEKSELFK
jgi:MoaA/NifB/PqqE/SkfB family radical SAM enzyme